MAVKNGGKPLRVMLAGHCDQIGLIVQHIDDDGFLYVQPIGGWDPQVLIGQRMTVWTEGGPLFGVIARKPIHLLTEEERKQVPKLKDLWLDIGAAEQGRGRKLVRVGDPVRWNLAIATLLQPPGRFAGDGRQVRLVGRHRGLAADRPAEAQLRPVCGFDGAGRSRAARAPDQHLRHRSAGRHRRRRDPCHRLPDDREESKKATSPWARGR